MKVYTRFLMRRVCEYYLVCNNRMYTNSDFCFADTGFLLPDDLTIIPVFSLSNSILFD
ncbi:hypothetical protein TSAR_005987 [Trichomalopsis sarcophagae]|uniref:Uncharacterized protein n=1 Tax=Trichomalopsis sarcophagae TaxID=543379 RepID=A0A232FDE3_9HYME|nr:hypothetical protein TSAR_005987 [Trichomalopsis sarcophagae]